MEGGRHFTVESKTFTFSLVGSNSFHITERNQQMVMYLFLNSSLASWVVKMVEEALDSLWPKGFFRKLRVGNGVLTLQHHINSRGSFLHLEEFCNGRMRGSLMVLEGTKGSGWEGFAYHLKKVAVVE